MNENITFLPYYRAVFPIELTKSAESNFTRYKGTLKVRAKAPYAVTNLSQAYEKELIFYGPGDIAGINPTAIARVEPVTHTKEFEANYFPFIEFRNPDFLWRYSLDEVNNVSQRVRPWLALIALKNTELQEMSMSLNKPALTKDNNGQISLVINKKYLPESENCEWASAHVQVNGLPAGDNSIEIINQYITLNPSKHCCRLFCLRKLKPSESYQLFLVPYYQAALDGTGENRSVFGTTSPNIITLPVYYSSSFMTSAFEDFETLAEKILPENNLTSLMQNVIDTSHNFPGEDFQDKFLLSEGALSVPGHEQQRQKFNNYWQQQKGFNRLINKLKESIKDTSEIIVSEEGPRSDVTMPYYGRNYQRVRSLEEFTDTTSHTNSKDTSPLWHKELNVDFRNRVIAGLGTDVVQKNQENYIKQCWYQSGKVRAANRLIQRTEAALRLSQSLEKRYLKSLSGDRFILRTAPFDKSIPSNIDIPTGSVSNSVSMKNRLLANGVSRGLLQGTFTKIVHRYVGLNNIKLIESLNPHAKILEAAPKRSVNAALMLEEFKKLGISLKNNFDSFSPPFFKPEIIKTLPVENIVTAIQNNFNHYLLTRAEIKLKNVISIQNKDKKISANFDPIIIGPEIASPMYEPLKSLSLDYIVPGIDRIPNNKVILLEENRRFIESYLVSVNYEMVNELLWQQFPIDQRATIFSNFWEVTTKHTENSEELRKDILPIHQWRRELGLNEEKATVRTSSPNSNTNLSHSSARLVLVIKADLVQRYPDVEIFACKCKGSYPGIEESAVTMAPTFRALLAPGILAIGFPFSLNQIIADMSPGNNFSYYFILQEHYFLPRFGLESNTEINKNERKARGGIPPSEFSWEMPNLQLDRANYIKTIPGLTEPNRSTAAHVAIATLQKPVQLIISAKRLLGDAI